MSSPVPAYYAPAPLSMDEEHVRLLSIFHYIFAGITALAGCCPGIYLFMGIAFLMGGFPPDPAGHPQPRVVGVVFIIMGATFILGFWTLAVLAFLAGRNLGRRRRHFFCFVVGCVECLFLPLGTILGVFTIAVLSRGSVKQRFGLAAPEGASNSGG